MPQNYQQVRPPSIDKIEPVIYEEASDIKNATAALYSSGLAILPSGMRLDNRLTKAISWSVCKQPGAIKLAQNPASAQ